MYVRGQDLAYILQDDFDIEHLKQIETYNCLYTKESFRVFTALEYLYLVHFLPRKYIPNPEQKVMKLHSVMTIKKKMK